MVSKVFYCLWCLLHSAVVFLITTPPIICSISSTYYAKVAEAEFEKETQLDERFNEDTAIIQSLVGMLWRTLQSYSSVCPFLADQCYHPPADHGNPIDYMHYMDHSLEY
jgi:hypothetical protein